MKPTSLIKDRFDKCFGDSAGTDTVEYYVLDASGADSVTGDIDESAAYSETGINLSAFIDSNPSKAVRERFGLEIEFDAVISLRKNELAENGVVPKIGDLVSLINDSRKFKVIKIINDNQVGGEFLTYSIAVRRYTGHK